MDSSFLNRLTLWWFNAIPVLGSRKALEVNDLYQLNEGSTSAYLVPKWESFWQPAMRSQCDHHVSMTLILMMRRISDNDENYETNTALIFLT
ncbi:unnamed protein product [Anisakis simplex]|uniref:Uncharacterized protein n=1 Tax=Anisakis simplex TaxID=6269 RepID=A0A3P6PLD1_ANISI|nr:unnamed protein product [Anisakis simplex]